MGCRWVLQPLFRKQWQGVGLSLSSSSFFLWYGLSLLLDEMRFKTVCLSFSCCFSFVGMWGKTLNLCAYVWVCVFFFLRFISWLHCHLAFGLSFPCTRYVYLPCPPQVATNFSQLKLSSSAKHKRRWKVVIMDNSNLITKCVKFS